MVFMRERAGSERDRKWWAAESGDEKIRSSRGRQKILVVGPAFMGGVRWQDKLSDFFASLRTSESKRFPLSYPSNLNPQGPYIPGQRE
jgi:hypothetical protein